MATAAVAKLPGKSPIQVAQEVVDEALALIPEEENPRAKLLECLTEQILCKALTVKEARQIVINWNYYRKYQGPVSSGMPKNYDSLHGLEMQMIRAAIARANGNVRVAAVRLKISVTTLYRKMHEINDDGSEQVG